MVGIPSCACVAIAWSVARGAARRNFEERSHQSPIVSAKIASDPIRSCLHLHPLPFVVAQSPSLAVDLQGGLMGSEPP